MSFSKLYAMQLDVLEARLIDVEVDISRGLHSFWIVGLADKAIEEAKDRIAAAIKNSGFDSPKSKNQRIVISLAPAELRKEGSNFDLAMALAYLHSIGEAAFDPVGKVFIGELSLNGSLRSVKGVLPVIIAAKRKGMKEIYIPHQNSEEGTIIEGISVYPVRSLREIVNHLDSRKSSGKAQIDPLQPLPLTKKERRIDIDLKEVNGQEGAKRALEIAAAGNHNIMLYGPPGTGKTMLARAFVSLLPDLSFDEMLEVTTIHASAGAPPGIIVYPPFRAPHHSATHVSIVGGGGNPRPGEVTLAHRGVLFMDEFPEFDQRVIDALRQPLEDKAVRITRLKGTVLFPCDFMLLASMNPCPCGFKGSRVKQCACSHAEAERYQRKVSGPIIDRIDIWAEVSEVDYKKLGSNEEGEDTAAIRARVARAQARLRSKKDGAPLFLSSACRALLDASAEALHLSARGYHKMIRLARTIACLEGKEGIEEAHILEALQYRPKS